MHLLDPSIEELLSAIRSSSLPSLADDIEAHLTAGKVPRFDRKQLRPQDMEVKREATLVSKDRGSSAPVEASPTDEELSEPFTREEQISEAIRLVTERLNATAEFAEDIDRTTQALGLENVKIGFLTGEVVEPAVKPEHARETLAEWQNITPRVRAWMETPPVTPDAE